MLLEEVELGEDLVVLIPLILVVLMVVEEVDLLVDVELQME